MPAFAVSKQLASGGSPLVQVVTKPGATTKVQAAATALAAKLSAITGGTFVVTTGDGSTGIAVGLGTDFTIWPFAGSYFNLSDPTRKEDYALRSHANGVYVAGATENAVEFAVWDLLYRMGYRQFTPSPAWEYVPSDANLAIDVDAAEHPDFYSRDIWYGFNTWGPDNVNAFTAWKAKNRVGKGITLNTAHSYATYKTDNISTLNAHPEYYALVGGVRKTTGTKFCLSNPGLRQMIVDDVLGRFAANPNLQSVSLEPSDEGGWCQCDECAAMGNGSITDRVIILNNQVAAAVDAVYPNQKYLGMYAYSYHSPPPSMNVHPRIVVSVATRLTASGWTTDSLLAGWAAKGATLGIREYYSVNFWDRDLPGRASASSRKYVAASIPKFLSKNAHFMNAESGDNWGPCGFGYYLASRFLWKSPAAIPVTALNSSGIKLDGFAGENTYGLVLPVNGSTGGAIAYSGTSGNLNLTFMTNSSGNSAGPTGYFVSYFPSKTLSAVGDKITVSFTGMLTGISPADQTLRLGLFSSGGNRLTANSLGTTSNALLNAYTGYRADYRAGGAPSSADTIRERTGLTQNLFSTGTMAPPITGAPTLGNANITANTPFPCTFEVEKTANGTLVRSVVNGVSGTATDTVSPFTTFDTFSIFGQAHSTINVTLTVSNLTVTHSPAATAIDDNLALIYNDFINKGFGPAAAPIDDFYSMCDKSGAPLLSADLIGRLYGKVQTALGLTSDPKIRARIYDLALYVRYIELYLTYAQEQVVTTRQTKFETLIRFAYRIRSSFMIHSLALYRDLEGRDGDVSIPANAKYDKLEPGNPWKTPSYPYTQAEIDTMITDGIANNPLLPWTPLSFSDDLIPATPLQLTTLTTGAFGQFNGHYSLLTYINSSPGSLSFLARAPTIGNPTLSLYYDRDIAATPVSAVTLDPTPSGTSGTNTPVTLTSPTAGVHTLRIVNLQGQLTLPAPPVNPTLPITGQAAPDAALWMTGRWRLHFYVPKGTTTLGGFSPAGAEGTLVDGAGVTRHTFNPVSSYYFTIPVPPGQDGKLWRFHFALGRRMLMTVPPYMAPGPNDLLLPREVVEADSAP